MKIKLIIFPKDNYNIEIKGTCYKNSYNYTIIFPSIDKYLEFIKNKRIYTKNFIDCDNKSIKYLEKHILEFSNLINNTKPIFIVLNINDIPNTSNVILDITNLSWNDKLVIINKANEETEFIDSYTCNEVLSLKEIKDIYYIINELVKNLRNLSPLEQIYSIYSYLKNRPYLKENENEDPTISRSLNHVLYNKPIVCLGFVNFFTALCNALGINTEQIFWKGNNNHVSNMCFINDTKYNITGILTTDVTWDALVKNTLKHFLNPLIIEETEKKIRGFEVSSRYNTYYKLIEKYKEYLQLSDNDAIIKSREELIEYINEIYRLLNIDKKVEYLCDLFAEINYIIDLTKVTISPIILQSIILNTEDLDNETCLSLLETSYHYISLNNTDKLIVRGFLNGSNSRNR